MNESNEVLGRSWSVWPGRISSPGGVKTCGQEWSKSDDGAKKSGGRVNLEKRFQEWMKEKANTVKSTKREHGEVVVFVVSQAPRM